jgi:hypothetical protein
MQGGEGNARRSSVGGRWGKGGLDGCWSGGFFLPWSRLVRVLLSVRPSHVNLEEESFTHNNVSA